GTCARRPSAPRRHWRRGFLRARARARHPNRQYSSRPRPGARDLSPAFSLCQRIRRSVLLLELCLVAFVGRDLGDARGAELLVGFRKLDLEPTKGRRPLRVASDFVLGSIELEHARRIARTPGLDLAVHLFARQTVLLRG